MNLRQLAYWLAVVENRSFTAAAQLLHISQPALSRQVQELERHVGGELLERQSGTLHLTAAGRALLPEARLAIATAAGALRTARQALGLETGTFELAALSTLAVGRLLPAIQQWRHEYPNVIVRLHEHAFRQSLEEAMSSGLHDLGVGTRPEHWDGPITNICWEEFVIVLPADDSLLKRSEAVWLGDLSARDWVMYDAQQGLSQLMIAACESAGFRPKAAVETMQVGAAAQLAEAGLGPALVPAHNVPAELHDSTRRLKRPVAWEITAYTRTSWSSAASAFTKILKSRVSSTKPKDALELTHW